MGQSHTSLQVARKAGQQAPASSDLAQQHTFICIEHVPARTKRLLDRLKTSRSHLPVIGIDQCKSMGETECRTSQDQGLREGLEPLAERLSLVPEEKSLRALLNQAGGLFE